MRPLNPGAKGPTIPLCEADEVASTLSDPQHFYPASQVASTSRPTTQPESFDTAGFEDEDIELQRALQASLQDTGGENLFTKPSAPGATSVSTTRPRSDFAQSAQIGFGDLTASSSGGDGLRELHASASRSRALLERARLDQQMAFQEQGGSRSSSSLRRNRPDEDQDQDEQLQRAVEESLKESGGVQMEDNEQEYPDLTAMDDDSDYYDAEDGSIHRQATPTHYPNTRSSTRSYSTTTEYIQSRPGASLPGFGQQSGASISETIDRVIDDEDAELQAALKASLEGVPEGFMIPESPKRTLIYPLHPGPSSSGPPVQISREQGEEDEEEIPRMVSEPPEEKQLSMEEIRRRRLARFGG